jgi:uncharacterized membrane protein HdeD (DUF308 family)
MDLVASPSRSTLVVRGLLNILLGLVAVTWPGLTLYILILIFAINILIVGMFAIFEPLFDKRNPHAVLTALLGILGVILGIFLIARPEIAAGVVTLLIAIWALCFGVVDLYAGFAASSEKIKGSWFLVLVGILSLVFGVYMLFNPLVGALTLVWVIGAYAILSGVILIAASFFVKSAKVKAVKKAKK